MYSSYFFTSFHNYLVDLEVLSEDDDEELPPDQPGTKPIPSKNKCGFHHKCYLGQNGSLRDVQYCVFITSCGCVYHRFCMRKWFTVKLRNIITFLFRQQYNNPVQTCPSPQHGHYNPRDKAIVDSWKNIRTGVVAVPSSGPRRGRKAIAGRSDYYVCALCSLEVAEQERTFTRCCFEMFHEHCLQNW